MKGTKECLCTQKIIFSEWCAEELKQLAEDAETVFICPIPMDQLTHDQKAAYRQATECHICEKSILPGQIKVRDHCHAHFIIRDICTYFDGKVDLLPLNKEKYIAFTKHVIGSLVSFSFIDSFRFMASSLEKLASYLDNYKIVYSEFSNVSSGIIRLLTRKGVLP